MRFSEDGFVRKKIRTSAFNPVKMAWRNVFRVPGRAVLIFCSLFLSMTMYLAVSIILGSTSVDMFVEMAGTNIEGNIYLRNGDNRICHWIVPFFCFYLEMSKMHDQKMETRGN